MDSIRTHLFNMATKLRRSDYSEKKEKGEEFNIFSITGIEKRETETHSALIYELLSPDGRHGQGDQFVRLFFEDVLNPITGDINRGWGVGYKVKREDPTSENRRIDITIQTSKAIIGIEIKITATDQDKQLNDYWKELQRRELETGKTPILLYLTLFGDRASERSEGNAEYHQISFKNDVRRWLDHCIEAVAHKPALREAICQYKVLIEKLTNQRKSITMRIANKIIKNKEDIIAAGDIHEAWLETSARIEFNFFQVLTDKIHGVEFIPDKELRKINKTRNAIGEKSMNAYDISLGSNNSTKIILSFGVASGNRELTLWIRDEKWDGPKEDDPVINVVENLTSATLKKDKGEYGVTTFDDVVLRGSPAELAKWHDLTSESDRARITEIADTINSIAKEVRGELRKLKEE